MTDPSGIQPPHPPNLHGTSVIVGDRGILITGGSDSGKTTLALRLIAAASWRGLFARLVADDQLFYSATGGRLICRTPPPIAGLAEIRGVGVLPVSHEPSTVIHLWVKLRPAAEIVRIPEDMAATGKIAGVAVPVLERPEKRAGDNVMAVLSWLFGNYFAADESDA